MSHCHTAGPENEPAESTACFSTVLTWYPRVLHRQVWPPAPLCYPLSLLSVLFLTEKEKQNTRRAHRYKLSRLTYPCLSTLLLGILFVNSIGTAFRIPSSTSTSTACFLQKHNSSLMGNTHVTHSPQIPGAQAMAHLSSHQVAPC